MLKWIAIAAALSAAPANADEATRCQIVVGGQSYLDAPCEFDVSDSAITIGVVETGAPSKHFAYILDGKAYWNGVGRSSKADTPLGAVTLNGACWSNATARLCVEGRDVLDLMGY